MSTFPNKLKKIMALYIYLCTIVIMGTLCSVSAEFDEIVDRLGGLDLNQTLEKSRFLAKVIYNKNIMNRQELGEAFGVTPKVIDGLRNDSNTREDNRRVITQRYNLAKNLIKTAANSPTWSLFINSLEDREIDNWKRALMNPKNIIINLSGRDFSMREQLDYAGALMSKYKFDIREINMSYSKNINFLLSKIFETDYLSSLEIIDASNTDIDWEYLQPFRAMNFKFPLIRRGLEIIGVYHCYIAPLNIRIFNTPNLSQQNIYTLNELQRPAQNTSLIFYNRNPYQPNQGFLKISFERVPRNDYITPLVEGLGFHQENNEYLQEKMGSLVNTADIVGICQKLQSIIPPEKRKAVFEISFRDILGYADNSEYLLNNQMLRIIDSISNSLKDLPIDQLPAAKDIAEKVFGTTYHDVNYDSWKVEDYLCIIHSFLNSGYKHLLDQEKQGDLLYAYHLIYSSLKSIEIEPEDIESPEYLPSFVEKFKDLNDEDLKSLCDTINDIYDTDCYADLKGGHSCEDWELLADQLRDLNFEQRENLSNFLSWLPSTFNAGPADSVEVIKDWLEEINALENFGDIEELVTYAFKKYEEQEKQFEALKLIIERKNEGFPDDEIRKELKRL